MDVGSEIYLRILGQNGFVARGSKNRNGSCYLVVLDSQRITRGLKRSKQNHHQGKQSTALNNKTHGSCFQEIKLSRESQIPRP